MEPILIQIQPGGSSEPDTPHDGEEFGYVIGGTVFLHLGNQKFRVRKGESFYYKPSWSTTFLTNQVPCHGSLGLLTAEFLVSWFKNYL